MQNYEFIKNKLEDVACVMDFISAKIVVTKLQIFEILMRQWLTMHKIFLSDN